MCDQAWLSNKRSGRTTQTLCSGSQSRLHLLGTPGSFGVRGPLQEPAVTLWWHLPSGTVWPAGAAAPQRGRGRSWRDHTGAWLSPGPSSGWDAEDRRVLVKLTWTLDQIVEPAAVIHRRRDFIYPVYDVYLCNS